MGTLAINYSIRKFGLSSAQMRQLDKYLCQQLNVSAVTIHFPIRKFGVVILDESHYIKNEKTARTKAVMPVCQAARRVMLLSGWTPHSARNESAYLCTALTDCFCK